MSVVAEPHIKVRDAYNRNARVTLYPVSRGTWTVEASIRKPKTGYSYLTKKFTGLTGEVEVGIAQIQAWDWLNEQGG